MNFHVVRLLQHEEAASVVRDLTERTFVDGKLTAHGGAREVKHNLQMERTARGATDLDRVLIDACNRSAEFQAFALPNRLASPLFSRYESGMAYGSHIDNSMMGGFGGVRTDLALTLFLSPPDTYDGGELVLELPVGEQEIKLDAGEAIVYSASSIHRVAPVTRGVRLAAVTWVQSCVHDERLRSILFDLTRALDRAEATGDKALILLLNKSYHNLTRHAAQP